MRFLSDFLWRKHFLFPEEGKAVGASDTLTVSGVDSYFAFFPGFSLINKGFSTLSCCQFSTL